MRRSQTLSQVLKSASQFLFARWRDFARGLRGNNFNIYAQVLQNLFTLHPELRIALRNSISLHRNKKSRKSFRARRPVHGASEAPAGLVYPGDAGVPRGLIQTQKTAFAPRVGVAWEPTGGGIWRVTSSYGMFTIPLHRTGGPLQDRSARRPICRRRKFRFRILPILQRSESLRARIYDSDDAGRARQKSKLPYAQDWNLNLQRSFGANWLLEVGYVGTKGTKLPRFIESTRRLSSRAIRRQTPADRRRLFSGCTRTDTNPCTFSSVGEIAGNTIPSTTRSKLV